VTAAHRRHENTHPPPSALQAGAGLGEHQALEHGERDAISSPSILPWRPGLAVLLRQLDRRSEQLRLGAAAAVPFWTTALKTLEDARHTTHDGRRVSPRLSRMVFMFLAETP